ncbi:MAG: [FeFe] hydrogenase H-cluster maturation GTPase HydF [Lachnospiraceae bacterium]|nr:[FeFe] hydrogenase H-cluster maturation GTPase HydF [Lachnospiraceae bacterium]
MLTQTPAAERIHIGIFGLRNAGKSSLINALTGQDLAIVSAQKGTTTDPVSKTMELLPLGPVVIIDTPGYDDEGDLGALRMEKTKQVLERSDLAILVMDAALGMTDGDRDFLKQIQDHKIPYLVVANKCDLDTPSNPQDSTIHVASEDISILSVSSRTGEGIFELKEALGGLQETGAKETPYLQDLFTEGDTVVLVCPIDESAPKGRMILPQQMAIRDILDSGGAALVIQPAQLAQTLKVLTQKPALVVCDSQAFSEVAKAVPEDIPLTSFSILMARYKGFLTSAIEGVKAIDNLQDGDRILIAEGCTHHRQCGDIGTVKIPGWLKKHTGKSLLIETASGKDFPRDLSSFALIIQCGGCMLTERDIANRRSMAEVQKVPFTNYGTAIAAMKGILPRSLAPLGITL